MRILTVHESYKQPGGEDQVFAAENRLLRDAGHDVETYTVSNEEIDASTRPVGLALGTVWNRRHHRGATARIRSFRPDVIHVHNTFPLISPAIYHAADAERVPVVQTLHNYRLACPGALLYRDGSVCTSCIGRALPLPAVAHGCYRDSRAASAATAAMLATHRLLGTWRTKVTRYIALTRFAKDVFVRAGLPRERLVVKPNFVDSDPGVGTGAGGYALFVGRLSEEKGVRALVAAAEQLAPEIQVVVVGDGPAAGVVARAADRIEGLTWLGRRPREGVLRIMRDAGVLLFPSEWYEGLPMTIIEAFACGLPVIASDLGAMASLIDDGRTGLLVPPGDAAALAERVRRTLRSDALRASMSTAAREEYVDSYTAERNLERLVRIYGDAIAATRPSRRAA